MWQEDSGTSADPRDTRIVLVKALNMLRTKREQLPQRKHGNMPL